MLQKDRHRLSQLALLIIMMLLLGMIFWFLSNLNIHRLLMTISFVLPATSSSPATPIEYNYGAIIDAGSSGSRLYVYTWPPHSGDPRDLLNITLLHNDRGEPVVKKVVPGLSTFENNPSAAMNHLRPLLDLAAASIPVHKHKETPLYVLATAGMRLLSADSQAMILDELRLHIRIGYNFLFSDQHVQVITGKQEGVFGWIATNYLLGRFDHNHHDGVPVMGLPFHSYGQRDVSASSSYEYNHGKDMHGPQSGSYKPTVHHKSVDYHRKRTVGVMDMGGASMQIAYELTDDSPVKIPDEYVATFNLGSREKDVEHTYRLYVTTFLGYGANVARQRYEHVLWQDQVSRIQMLRRTMVANQMNLTLNATRTKNGTQLNSVVSLKAFNFTALDQQRINEIADPCLPKGLSYQSRMKWIPKDKRPLTKVTFKGTGNYHQCTLQTLRLLGREKLCPVSPCSMNGVYQAPIDFLRMEFYGFSEFWYSTADILHDRKAYQFDRFTDSATNFCSLDWLTIASNFRAGVYSNTADLNQLKMQCHKAAWISSVLHYGLQFPKTYRKLHPVLDIRGTEVQWSLGAMLYHTRYMPLRDIQRREFLQKRLINKSRVPELYEICLLLTAIFFVFLVMSYLHNFCGRHRSYSSFTKSLPLSHFLFRPGKYVPMNYTRSKSVLPLFTTLQR